MLPGGDKIDRMTASNQVVITPGPARFDQSQPAGEPDHGNESDSRRRGGTYQHQRHGDVHRSPAFRRPWVEGGRVLPGGRHYV